MFTTDTLTTFLGWCLVINAGLLVLTSVSIMLFGNSIAQLHGRLFGIDHKELAPSYFSYMAQFKILLIVFNFTPYIALKLVS